MNEVVLSIMVSDSSSPRQTGSDAAAVAHEIIFGYEVLMRSCHWDRMRPMQPLPRLPKLPRKRRGTEERCGICGCRLHRGGGYALPTPEGRSHATEHHYVAERFFGRSANRRNERRERVFDTCPWDVEGQSGVFCYECHEELLHNPVFTSADIELFAALVRRRGLQEEEKTVSREKLAGRIQLLHAVIAAGLKSLDE